MGFHAQSGEEPLMIKEPGDRRLEVPIEVRMTRSIDNAGGSG